MHHLIIFSARHYFSIIIFLVYINGSPGTCTFDWFILKFVLPYTSAGYVMIKTQSQLHWHMGSINSQSCHFLPLRFFCPLPLRGTDGCIHSSMPLPITEVTSGHQGVLVDGRQTSDQRRPGGHWYRGGRPTGCALQRRRGALPVFVLDLYKEGKAQL